MAPRLPGVYKSTLLLQIALYKRTSGKKHHTRTYTRPLLLSHVISCRRVAKGLQNRQEKSIGLTCRDIYPRMNVVPRTWISFTSLSHMKAENFSTFGVFDITKISASIFPIGGSHILGTRGDLCYGLRRRCFNPCVFG